MLDFTALYERHAGDVLRFALYLTGNRAEAEDIVSETFTRVWTARERVELSTVKGYLFTIARNLHLHERRRKLRQGEFPDEPADGGPGPEAAVCERDQLDAVLAAL